MIFSVGLRVLIVDDNDAFLESARALLEREGLEVVGAAVDGAAALQSATAAHPEVALVDVDLGEESGVDVAAHLAEACPQLRVILMSARPAEDLLGILGQTTALGFLAKRELSRRAIERLMS
jgi:DNA-binding NarL/FixJ family response regulator